MVKKIRDGLGGVVAGKTIAVLGLTFKPETDDMREAPAITILPALLEKGAHIKAHDPQGMREAARYLPEIEYVETPYQACEGADALVLMTEWNQYRALDLPRIKALMKTPNLIDLRNIFEPRTAKEYGFNYMGIGRF